MSETSLNNENVDVRCRKTVFKCLTLASSTTLGFITKRDCLFGILSSIKGIENQCSSGLDVAAEMHAECVAFESATETLCDFCNNPSIKPTSMIQDNVRKQMTQ
jgi:hypothetical protein